MKRKLRLWLLPLWTVWLAGCGYSLQNSHNPLREQYGVSKIYIAPVRNETFKAGIENLVFNALVRTIGHHKRVRIVTTRADADAELVSSVNMASLSQHSSTTADKLSPLGSGPEDVIVTTVYDANLGCTFRLFVLQGETKGRNIWYSGFDRQKRFPANSQLGAAGTTSALINDSEFERALGDLADAMMEDVHESMLAMF